MFVFLTRLGRLFVATVVLAGVISIIGVMSVTGILVASHHNASGSTGCTLSATAVGAPLVLSGSGYTPGATYGVNFLWPNGTQGGTAATANSSGVITSSTYAWWSGTYTAQVSTMGGKSHLMATCTVTV